jgi:hypothetical protein
MSDTPRTDAAEYEGTWGGYAVNAELSRELERENNELRELVRLITIEEISDSGHTFCPTQITSCRCIDLEKIHTILQKYKPTKTL